MPLSHWTDVSADWFPEVASGSRSSDSRGSREVDMVRGTVVTVLPVAVFGGVRAEMSRSACLTLTSPDVVGTSSNVPTHCATALPGGGSF